MIKFCSVVEKIYDQHFADFLKSVKYITNKAKLKSKFTSTCSNSSGSFCKFKKN